MTTLTPEQQLRKAWLLQKFGSWEYHEEMLELHAEFLSLLKRHWAKSGMQQRYPDCYQDMQSPVFFNFDMVFKPGTVPKSSWKPGVSMGDAATICYNIGARGLGDTGFDPYMDMSDDELALVRKVKSPLRHHCTNIRRTADNTWDTYAADTILSDEYTGPIDWPANWMDDLPKELVASLEPNQYARRNVAAGKTCPESGWWFTASKPESRRYFMKDQTMPSVDSDYGETIWQWSPDQSTPNL